MTWQGSIIAPIHALNHWQLLVIDKELQTFLSVDSLGGSIACLPEIRAHLQRALPQVGFDRYTENRVYSKAVQLNGTDCGVFVCEFARLAALGLPWPQSFDATELRANLKEVLTAVWEKGETIQGSLLKIAQFASSLLD